MSGSLHQSLVPVVSAMPEMKEDICSVDDHSIRSISFCPNVKEVMDLIEQSILANKDLSSKTRSSLLSKCFKVPATAGLLPESVDPEDTILCTLGKKFGKIKDVTKMLTILDDRNMPFIGGSNGPNGILLDCQSMTYGFNRVNLFHITPYTSWILLKDYMGFRDRSINQIFNAFCSKLCSKYDTTKFSEEMNKDYELVGSMFTLVKDYIRIKDETLESCGVGCVSFCQTWMRKGEKPGDAQFSVMSPHFQNRFYITHREKLIQKCGITEEMEEAYIRVIKYFTESMKEYGTIEGGLQSFINCDELLSSDILVKINH